MSPRYQEPVRADPAAVWGVQSEIGPASLPQKYALVVGVVYLLIGVLGFFFTGFSYFTESHGSALFGIFHVTPFHNIVHVGIGALSLIAALALSRPATEGANLAIAGVLVVAALLGYRGSLEYLGIEPGLDADTILHLVLGVVTLLFAGLIPAGRHS